MARKPHRDEDWEDEDEEELEDERRSSRSKRPLKQLSNVTWFVILGLAGAGVLLTAVCVVVIAVVALKDRSQQAEVKPFAPPLEKDAPLVFPDLGQPNAIQPGILFREATLQRRLPMKVWYYEPQNPLGKLALVVVPPAGSTLACGMDLGEGDRPEHFPYVRAGFAVMSFEIDGHVPNVQNAPDAMLFKGAREFRDARAGLDNARAALDFILAKAPQVDASRIYIAGHSSAATLALLTAEHEPRIKGCASFCGVPDVEERLAPALAAYDRAIPGFRDFIRFSSPKTHADQLRCPVFLFHAQDDNNVPVRQTTAFATLLKKTNPNITLVLTPRGGHYDSMLHEGVPKCIDWLKKLPK